MTAPPRTIVVTRQLPDGWLDRLAGHRLVVGPAEPGGWDDALWEALPEADALLCLLTETVDAAVLDRAPKLRVVSNMAVGVDNIDVDACTQRKIPVGHTPKVLTDATADLAMALMLSAARRLPEAAADAAAGRWSTWSPTGWLGADLHGATLGIVGMGKIGRAVCQRALGFGLRVIYATRTTTVDILGEPQPHRVRLDELLATSDFISIHVPLTDQTRKMIDAAALSRIKPTAILVNTSRGPVVDTDALVDALQQGRIRAAALDVTDPEPLPPEHPLYRLPNALVIPHIGSATHGTRRRMAQLACDNILAALRGDPLPHCVNPAVYG